MAHKNSAARRIASVILALMVPLSSCMPPVSVEVQAADTAHTSYEGEKNKMTDQQYAEFGLANHSPEEFNPENEENPLQDFEPTYISELYLGYMNKSSKWKGEYFVMDETSEISGQAFNIDNMDNNLIGGKNSFKGWYEEKKDTKEVQTNNACAIDYDGDGTDEILNVTLYVQKKLSNPDKRSRMDVRLVDYQKEKNVWTQAGDTNTYDLVNKDSDDSSFVWNIEADTSKGYTAVAAGDFNGDGKEEAAVYVPSQIGNNPYVAVLSHDGKKFTEVGRIYVSELNEGGNEFNFRYKSLKMPVVSLSTTKISGQDDLVVNVSHPLQSGDEYSKHGQNSAMGIYHFDGNKKTVRYFQTLTYNSTRLRFASAVDGDLNGNGAEELIIGGYKNIGWNSPNDVGKLDSGKNLIQLLCWNSQSGKYEAVWDEPKEVEARGGLKVDTSMMEPAALTAARLQMNSKKDHVFLEGVVFQFNGSSTGTTEKECLKGGSFSKELSINLDGSHSAFISTACAAKFSSAGGDTEQIVVLSGDHQQTDNDQIYYDIGWVWGTGTGLTSTVTNNNYINRREEDDDGTFISLCPLDVDQDAAYLKYTGKTYGWSDPVLYSVLQSPPYWSELKYNSETFGAGEVSYGISYGNGSATEGEWGVGLGYFCDVSVTVGVGAFGTGGSAGAGTEMSAMASYLGSYAAENSTSDSYEITIAPGEDQAVVMAVPMVNYHYDMWVPTYEVTKEHIENYEKMKEQDPTIDPYPYTLGEKVEGHWEETNVEATLDPSLSHIPLEEYNKLAEKYAYTGIKPVTPQMLAAKTIGDPSTYPHSEAELRAPGNVKNLHLSKHPAAIQIGEGVTKIAYEMETGTEESHGFQLSFDRGVYAKMKATSSLVVESEFEAEAGFRFAMDGGASWVSSSSQGQEFSAAFSDLASGTRDEYRYSANLAVFQADNLPMGSENSDCAYVVGYVVTGVDEASAPPSLPVDFRVFGTKENAAVLKWDASPYRPAKSYEIFVEDNQGMPASVGKTQETYFTATGLDPSTTYRFAVKSYVGEGQSGIDSSMSRWLAVTTKDSKDSAPSFTEYPKNEVVTPGDGTPHVLTAAAQKGQGMENAELTYQWQKYSQDALTKDGVWENIEGAVQAAYSLPQVTAENVNEFPEQTHYRAIARQIRGSSVSTIISKTATMFVNKEGGLHQYYGTSLSVDMPDQENLLHEESADAYYVQNPTDKIICKTALQAENGTKLSGSGIRLMYRKEDPDGQKAEGLIPGETDSEGGISLGSLTKGDYELFAVYPGGAEGSTDTQSYYLPSQSDPITLHVTEAYGIQYHLDGGINDPANPSVLTSDSPGIELSPATKRGFQPAGWYVDEACETPLPDNTLQPQTLTGTVDLYAKWEPCSYQISYQLEEGVTNHPDNPGMFTVNDGRIILKKPSRAGYVFKGWYMGEGFTDEPVRHLFGTAASPVTLYAKWESINQEKPLPEGKKPQPLRLSKTNLKKKAGASSVTLKVKGAKSKTAFTSSDQKVATVSKNGKIRFIKPGTAYITVFAPENENYSSFFCTCTVTVIPKTAGVKSVTSPKKGQIRVKSDKNAAGNTGYQIQYKIKGQKKTYRLDIKSKTTVDKAIRGLKSGSKVKVRLRAYKKIKDKTYYGHYGAYKTVTVK